jgi:hypothetical protein
MTVRARRLPQRVIALSATVGLVGGLAIASPESASAAANAPIAVTSTADAGPGSLRQAILDANAAPGADVIAFDFGAGPSAVSVITLTSLAAPGRVLPAITDSLTIDGSTAPGWSATTPPLVEVISGGDFNGASAFTVDGPGTAVIQNLTVAGEAANGFGVGVDVLASPSVTVQRNQFGVTADGNAVAGPLMSAGIRITGGENDRRVTQNLIANARHGIEVNALRLVMSIDGNTIGLSRDGTIALPVTDGIALSDSPASTSGNTIVGTPSGHSGISVDGSVLWVSDTFIGTRGDGTGTFRGRTAGGIIATATSSPTTLNVGHSVIVHGDGPGIATDGNEQGVDGTITQNDLSDNAQGGVRATGKVNHLLNLGGNYVSRNGLLGIDTGAAGINTGEDGPPVIDLAAAGDSQVHVTYDGPASSAGAARVYLSNNTSCDASTQGETPIDTPLFDGAHNITLDAEGNFSGVVTTTDKLVGGQNLTAQITPSAGISTEYSTCRPVPVPPNRPPTAAPVSASVPADGSTVGLTLSGNDPDGDPLTFAVTDPGNGTVTTTGEVTCDGATPSTCTTTVTYQPSAGFIGQDSFGYTVNDGTADSDPATATIVVQGPGTHTVSVSTDTGTGYGVVTSDPAGVNCPLFTTLCSASFDSGQQVTLTATTDPGSTFFGWNGGGCSGTGTCVVSTDTDVAVEATFVRNVYTVAVQRIGTGSGTVTSQESTPFIDCGTTCTSTGIGSGYVTVLHASAAAASQFTGWTGRCQTGGPADDCSVTSLVNEQLNVQATFDTTVIGLGVVGITPVSVDEGAGKATVTVTRDGNLAAAAHVDLATTAGTATAVDDYTNTSATVAFPAGIASVRVDIPIVDDRVTEPSEAFGVVLFNPVGVGAGVMAADVTILDNDPQPVVSLAPIAGSVSESATSGVGFTATLDRPSASQVTVAFTTVDGTATAPADYTALSRRITFAPNSTSATVTVALNNDALLEPSETIKGQLSAPTSASLGTAAATLTILDDESRTLPGSGPQRVLVLHKTWVAPTVISGLPDAVFSLQQSRRGSIGTRSIASTALIAADGSSCDTDADKRAGCQLTLVLPTDATTITEPSPAVGWVASYSGACPGTIVGTSMPGILAPGANPAVCTVTNTYTDPRYRDGSNTQRRPVILHEIWNPTTSLPLPDITVKVTGGNSRPPINWTIGTSALFAADGTACDSDTDKLAGCTLTLAVNGGYAYQFIAATPPTGWVSTFSGDCPGMLAGTPPVLVGQLNRGPSRAICTIINTGP